MHPEEERTVSKGYCDFFDVVHFVTHFTDDNIYTCGILSDDIDVISIMSIESKEGMVIFGELFVVTGRILSVGFINDYH